MIGICDYCKGEEHKHVPVQLYSLKSIALQYPLLMNTAKDFEKIGSVNFCEECLRLEPLIGGLCDLSFGGKILYIFYEALLKKDKFMSDLIQELYIEGDTCVFCGHELEDNKFVCSDENREFFNEAASLFLLKNFIPIDILDILENLQWSVCHRCFEDYEAKIIDKIPIEKLPLFINTVKTEKGKLAFKRKLGYKKDIIEFKLQ